MNDIKNQSEGEGYYVARIYEKKDSTTEGTDGKSQQKEDIVAFEYGSAGSDMATTTSIPSYGWNHNGFSGLQDIFQGSILYQ